MTRSLDRAHRELVRDRPEIKDLSDRERRVLYLRFFSEKTQSEIARCDRASRRMHLRGSFREPWSA